ncbi:MAG: dihydroorotase [Flavobacteriaceae bacterium]|nr:dihydroorotase [Flavobacteriaceae bacterium]
MKRTIIKNANIVNEGKIFESDILIEDLVISKISKSISPKFPNTKIIDAEANFVIPGLIDDQVHFREPGLTHKGNIYSESRASVAGGITSFFEMPNTYPNTVTINELNNKFKIAKENSIANYSFMFGGTNSNLEEILKNDTKEIPAIKLFLGSSTGNMLVDDLDSLEKIFSNVNIPIAVHCEDEKTIKENLKLHVETYGDDIPINYHSKIRSEEACFISSSMAVDLAKKTGARLHVFHLSSAKELELFSNKIQLKNKKITSEVCIHHLTFCDEDYDKLGSKIKWNPSIKTSSDREKLWDALNNDLIDVIATDHAPHTLKEKHNPYTSCPSGGPLVQHSLVSMLDAYHNKKISLEKIVQKMCHNPAILFDVSKRGYVREGFYADLVIFNLNNPWKVSQDNLMYKCGWSPFENKIFKSRILHTLVNGNLVYSNGKIIESGMGMKINFIR